MVRKERSLARHTSSRHTKPAADLYFGKYPINYLRDTQAQGATVFVVVIVVFYKFLFLSVCLNLCVPSTNRHP